MRNTVPEPNGVNGPVSQIDRNYSVYYEEKVGEGAYGIIYKGFSKKDNKIVAVKKLKADAKSEWSKNPAIRREVEVMKKIQHENVLTLYDAIENQTGVYIITEYCNGGDLKKVMSQAKARQKQTGQEDTTRSGLSEIEVFRYFFEIVQGMAEVNRIGVIHRDLKPENIMLNEQNRIKIADFGLAREIIGSDIYKLEKYSAKGTPIYAAPQVIRGKVFSGLCDVWSCGLLVYELLTGRNYFEAATNMYNLQSLQDKLLSESFKVPSHFDSIFRQTLPLMVSYNEETRVCFIELAKALMSNRAEIEKRIDPTNRSTRPAISIRQQPYVNDKPMNTMERMMPTQDMATLKQIEERNYMLIVEVFRYMDFLYTRGRLLIEAMNRMNTSTTYPIDSGCKYTLIFLQLGIFMSTVNSIIDYLRQPVMLMPSGNRIVKEQLDPKSKQNLLQYIDEYCQKVQAEKNNFRITLQQITNKLLSDSYKKRFPGLYQRYPNIYSKLSQMTNGKDQALEWYEEQYRNFLGKECRLQQLQVQSDDVVRVYWMCLALSNLRKFLPDQQYQDKNIVTKIKENFDKAPRATIMQGISAQ